MGVGIQQVEMEHLIVTLWDSVLEGEYWIMLGERFKGGVFKMKLDYHFIMIMKI